MNSETISIRAMEQKDVLNVKAIEDQAHSFPWSEQIFRDCIDVGYFCNVAFNKENMIGFTIMSIAVEEAHLLNITIVPSSQGQGYGRQLLEHVVTIAKKKYADTLFLEVRESNQAALNLYYGYGFDLVNVRKDYYPHAQGREDAMVLGLKLF